MSGSSRSSFDVEQEITPRKRRKVEPQERNGHVQHHAATPIPDIGERCTDFWFDEGNVIIAALDRAFKVHTSILMLRSEVFGTLLSSAALSQIAERLNGCPVLRVDDKGRDLHDLLYIIYNGGNSDWLSSKRKPIAYDDFRVVVPIAVKYQVREIFEDATCRLARVFPTDSLHRWNPNLQPDGDATPIQLVHIDCIDLLRIVRLLDMRSIIPLVFYAICNICEPESVADGADYEDGTPPVTLSPADLRTYLAGRQKLTVASLHVLRAFHELTTDTMQRPACASRARCDRALQLLSLSAVDDELYCDPSPIDAMDPWIANTTRGRTDAKPCRVCDEALRQLINERREEAWRNLGTIFDVDEWPAAQNR